VPTPAEACERLSQPQNEPLRWLLGEALVARSQRAAWHECRVLQQLAGGSEAGERAWNGLIERSRQALTNPEEAQTRARAVLTPGAADFDEKLDDLVAEMVAVVYLSAQGFSRLHFIPTGEISTPDLTGVKRGQDAFIEVKNLREPPSLTIVAFSRWNANRTRNPERFNSTLK
jgi:hypothetical protein